ncbi:MAG TPA: hypothetical protein VMR70_02300 [Flavisolibacter sp.]|nr:hypothetical protein [Flavisolibacter sp.]
MLKIVFVLAAFCTTFFASAQTKPFVEVVVEDTIQIDADEIIYHVGHVDWTSVITVDTAAFDTMAVVPDVPVVNRLQDVRQLIKTMQLDTLKEVRYTVSHYEGLQEPGISIRFLSIDKLKEFADRIRQLENTKGTIIATKSSKEKATEKILFQRLYNQAKKKAETLAQIAGKKLGDVIVVKEKEQQGGWTMYPALSTIPGWHAEVGTGQNGKVILYRGLIVQFDWQ